MCYLCNDAAKDAKSMVNEVLTSRAEQLQRDIDKATIHANNYGAGIFGKMYRDALRRHCLEGNIADVPDLYDPVIANRRWNKALYEDGCIKPVVKKDEQLDAQIKMPVRTSYYVPDNHIYFISPNWHVDIEPRFWSKRGGKSMSLDAAKVTASNVIKGEPLSAEAQQGQPMGGGGYLPPYAGPSIGTTTAQKSLNSEAIYYNFPNGRVRAYTKKEALNIVEAAQEVVKQFELREKAEAEAKRKAEELAKKQVPGTRVYYITSSETGKKRYGIVASAEAQAAFRKRVYTIPADAVIAYWGNNPYVGWASNGSVTVESN